MGISRRTVLIRSVALIAATQSTAIKQAWAAGPKSKPGVQMYMFKDGFQTDPAGTLASLAAIGYGYVEAFAPLISNVAVFKKMIGDAGLGCPSGHLPFGIVDTEKVLDFASSLGVRYAVSSVMVLPKAGGSNTLRDPNRMSADDYKRMAAFSNRIGESAAKRGIKFAYHSHGLEFLKLEGGTTGLEIFLKETDPDLVKLQVDVGWVAAGGGDPVALIEENAQRVRLLHFKDFSTITPPVNKMEPESGAHIVNLGSGVVPLKAAYKAARKAGAEYFIVDHDPPFHDETLLQAAKVDYDYVAGLLAS